MKKKIRALQPGETFKTPGFGEHLLVEKLGDVRETQSHIGRSLVKVYFVTPRGNRMFQDFAADKEVEVLKNES